MYLMQQDEVISELIEHARSSSSSEDFTCARYLSALNDIFERTILGKKTRIFKPNGSGMQRLDDGFMFFEEWCLELKQLGEFNSGVESKLFLSWQVHLKHNDCSSQVAKYTCTCRPGIYCE